MKNGALKEYSAPSINKVSSVLLSAMGGLQVSRQTLWAERP
ncbi:hypothetical protein DCCM_4351 [Desulfocucumis palustris]|uniref:Uncharacterized protein n=1 Tax=Desulfocucumis palustris TaxID=1898651 RepID=A0A2L2XG47_9FIRM|nr:hypothetical protein DCCM_4351 [Desulfocucumis palustris]